MQGSGISLEVPPGWEARMRRRPAQPGPPEGVRVAGDGQGSWRDAGELALLHAATFELPVDTEDFGGRAVERMRGGDAVVCLVEYGAHSVGTALFAAQGLPRALKPANFSENALQHNHPGQSGCQRFFVEADRAWCLYVVIGRHLGRSRVVPRVNELLRTVQIN